MKRKYILFILSALFLVYIIGNAIAIYQYGSVNEKQKCDVAIVLGAATNSDGVSPVYEERINHAISLYRNNFVDYKYSQVELAEEIAFQMHIRQRSMLYLLECLKTPSY